MSTQPPYLTQHEIDEICAPRRQGAAQIRYLESIGVKVRARPDGKPLVWRADVERPEPPGGRATVKASNQPNWTRTA